MGDFRYTLLGFLGLCFAAVGTLFVSLGVEKFWIAAKPMYITSAACVVGMIWIRFFQKKGDYVVEDKKNQ